jgi:hypothetical protein
MTTGNEFTGDLMGLHSLIANIKLDGNWVTGLLHGYKVEIKLFAEDSIYGIGGGRISKLWVATDENWDIRRVVVNYDRGWDRLDDVGLALKLTNNILAAICEPVLTEIPQDFEDDD